MHQAASAVLENRRYDGRDAIVNYTPGSGPGVWVPTPPAYLAAQAPETPYVKTFALGSASQFRPDPPPSLGSDDWARDYDEVQALGAAVGSSRTTEQTDIARFWSDNPPLQWNRAWRALSMARGLGLAENARYFAMLTSASADALIACWDAKYFYNFWRPVTAIRAGDSDGNPAGCDVDRAPHHPEPSRVPGRARLLQRRLDGDAQALLRHRRGRPCRGQHGGDGREPRSHVCATLGRVGGGPRGADLWRNALPELDPGRGAPGKAGVEVHDDALVPSRPA